jgi:hypothetical protein
MQLDCRNVEMTNPSESATRAEILLILHRTAQPLSTVRGILELILADALPEDEKRMWLQQAVQQTLQVVSSFTQLREVAEECLPTEFLSGEERTVSNV